MITLPPPPQKKQNKITKQKQTLKLKAGLLWILSHVLKVCFSNLLNKK